MAPAGRGRRGYRVQLPRRRLGVERAAVGDLRNLGNMFRGGNNAPFSSFVIIYIGSGSADKETVAEVLREVVNHYHEEAPFAFIHGECSGADELAKEWAMKNGYTAIGVPANWDFYGKAAGPLRNGAMIEFCEPDMVVAFPGGRGTQEMIRLAEKAGLYVMKIKE